MLAGQHQVDPKTPIEDVAGAVKDLKLTMKVYTNASQVPLIAEAARLSSFTLPWNHSKKRTQISTQEAVVLGSKGSPAVASSRAATHIQVSELVALRREKAAGDVSSGFS